MPYVIGGDTAGTGSDWFVGQVLDNRTGEQVAVLHHQFGERMYAEQMYCLGMYYNTALIGVETNYSTYPEMETGGFGIPEPVRAGAPGQLHRKDGAGLWL